MQLPDRAFVRIARIGPPDAPRRELAEPVRHQLDHAVGDQQQQRKALIHEAVTGKIDLSGAAEESPLFQALVKAGFVGCIGAPE